MLKRTAGASVQDFRLAYHFCDGTGQQSQRLPLILRSLLRQLCHSPTADISTELKERVEREQEGELRASEIESFLTWITSRHNTILIVDAVDEISRDVCLDLLRILTSLAQPEKNPVYTKIFVSSRPVDRIERLLHSFNKITVHNSEDLGQFINVKLSTVVEESYGNLESYKAKISEALSSRADGMWVSQVDSGVEGLT